MFGNIYQFQISFLIGVKMKGFLPSIIFIVFFILTSSTVAPCKDSGDTACHRDALIICMDMMDLDFPGEDDEDALALPPMKSLKKISPPPVEKPVPSSLEIMDLSPPPAEKPVPSSLEIMDLSPPPAEKPVPSSNEIMDLSPPPAEKSMPSSNEIMDLSPPPAEKSMPSSNEIMDLSPPPNKWGGAPEKNERREKLSPGTGQMAFPPIKKLKDPNAFHDLSNYQKKTGEDKKIKFKARSSNRPDPSYSPGLSPFLYPIPSRKIDKGKRALKSVQEKKREAPAKDFSLELKEITLPQSPAAKIKNSFLNKKVKSAGKQAAPQPEMPLLGEMPLGQQRSVDTQQQSIINNPVIELRTIPVNRREHKKAPPAFEERQPPPSPESNDGIDPKLLNIYERFYKK